MDKTTASIHDHQRTASRPRWAQALLATALCGTALAAALSAGPARAQATAAPESANPASTPASMAQLPAVRTSGTVKYLTGGVGKEESDMIKAESRHWPLTLEFAVRTQGRAQFASDVDVIVRNAAGQDVLHAKSDGPFLLARLEPGAYTVQATLNGQAQNKPVKIEKDRPLRLLISWPPGNGRAPE